MCATRVEGKATRVLRPPAAVLPLLPLALVLLTSSALAQSWPSWRGPSGDNIAAKGASPPIEWSEDKNVRWKVPIPGVGASTPVVHEGRIYVTSAIDTGREGEPTAPKDAKRPLPLVVIHTDLDTFNRELARVLHVEAPAPLGTERVCELDSGSSIAPNEMIRLALHGTVRRLVCDSPSHVLDYGHDVRLFTGKLRQAIIHAARTCAAPGCEVRASRCEIDHVLPAAVGGRTESGNGRPLCTSDHRARPGPP